jgi:ABC-type transporter Mla subunit MlaD
MSGVTGRVGLNLAVVIVLSMVVVAATGFRLLGLFGADERELVVDLPASGGVQPAQPVTVRGTGVGVVRDVELTADGVRVVMDVANAHDVPRHVFVQVLRRSPIGEQAVELTPVPADWESPGSSPFAARDVPRAEGWQRLEEGEQPDVRGMAMPASVPDVLRLGEDLLANLDPEALTTVVEEVGTAFEGRDDVLRRLTRDGTDLAETLLGTTDDIERLLAVSEPTLRTLHEQRDELRAGLANSATLLDTLAARGDDVATILDAAPGALGEATRLVEEQAPNLSCLNRDMLALGRLLADDDTLPYLAQLMDLQSYFYGSFDAGTQWDPYRPQALWARVNILLLDAMSAPPAAVHEPRTPTPPTLPGAHCDSPFGLGVDAVRQSDPDPLPPESTSPGIDHAPRQQGAGDRADHDLLREARERRAR